MFANASSLTVNPMFLRHDLLIELGRLEIAIEDARGHAPANDHEALASLETRRAAVSATLSRLTA